MFRQRVDGKSNFMAIKARKFRRMFRPASTGWRLSAWLGVLVVLFNVFGGVLVAKADPARLAAAQASASLAIDAAEVCGHPADGQQAPGPETQHGGPYCPMCFPMGSVCSGALAPTAGTLFMAAPVARFVGLPVERRGTGLVLSHCYDARAPPSFA